VKKEKIGYFILAILALSALIAILLVPPIKQNEEYHNFSDKTTLLNIPNFWNVVSNLPFLIVGLVGLFKLNSFTTSKIQYGIFFTGIALVSFGSGYYHWNPNSNTLVWDRLPMTIAFMALCSIIISEFINDKTGRLLLWPLLIIGVLSVLYWVVFKDLRFYALVQYYPMVAMPVILIFFKSRYNLTGGYWLLLLAYLIAKLFEYYDYQVQNVLVVVSGHTLKHIAASLGIFILLYTYLKRKEKPLSSLT
jgi:hypothetical protein